VAPPAENVHWLFGTGFLLLGLLLLAEAIVGPAVWRRRTWRVYLWPSLAFALGALLWPVAVFFTSSTLHMLAHTVWAEVAILAGAVQIALARGRLTSRWWGLTLTATMVVSGAAFLIHEQNGWLFSRSAFLHHAIGWVLVAGAAFPVGQALRPRLRTVWVAGFALVFVTVAALLFADRDLAPIFGHLSDLEGQVAR
jgi:hypothetical protein